MTINAAIPLQVQRPRKTNAMAEMMQAMQMRNAAQQMKTNQAKFEREAAYRNALAESGGTLEGMREVAAQFGDIDTIQKLDAHGRGVLKGQREGQKHALEMALEKTKLYSQWLGGVADEGSYQAFRQRVAQVDPEDAMQMPEGFSPEAVKQMRLEGLSVEQQLSHALRVATLDETRRSNRSKEGAAWARAQAAQVGAGSKGFTESFNRATKLRNEYTKAAGEYVKVRDAFGRVEASADNPSHAGDLSLIYAYMKMLDPGSTVMQGEQALAQNAGSVPERVRAQYNGLLTSKGTLTKKMRNDFVSRARALYGRAESSHKKRVKQYTGLAKRAKVDPSDVVVDLGAATENVVNWGDLK